MPLDSKLQKKYKKTTDYTTVNKLTRSNIDSSCTHTINSQKRPISPNQLNTESTSKRSKSELFVKMDDNLLAVNSPSTSNFAKQNTMDGNDCDKFQKALDPC